MTEIAVYPPGGGSTFEPTDAEPTTDIAGLLGSINVGIGRLVQRQQQQRAELLQEAAALGVVRIDPTPVPLGGGFPAGFGVLDVPQMFRPQLGLHWDIHTISVQGLPAAVAAAGTSASGALAAGAGSASLPAGASATGFTVSFTAATSAAGTLTLSNVAGGNQVFNIPSGQTAPYTVVLPAPLAASGGAPTLTAAGMGTGAGTILLNGTTAPVAAGVCGVYLNLPAVAVQSALGAGGQLGAARAIFTGGTGSGEQEAVQNFGAGQLLLRGNNDRLVFVVSGAGAGPVLVSVDGTRVADAYLGRYLL